MKISNLKQKMQKIIKTEIAVGIIMFVVIVIGGSIWLANKTPQTAPQRLSSLIGVGKPEANAPSRIVFLGDSITAQEDWNVLFGTDFIHNAGISGDTTDDILARLDTAIASKPKKLFLMAGINDLIQGKDVAHVLKNYEMILDRIRNSSPDTVIYVQSILPIHSGVLKYGYVDSENIISLNKNLVALAEKRSLSYINLYPNFCGSDNMLYAKYTSDGLHPNSHGYAIWKDLIAQYVK